MSEIRQLTVEDAGMLEDLLRSHPKAYDLFLEQNRPFIEVFSNPNARRFGVISEDGEMLATISITLWKVLPYATMTFMVQRYTTLFDSSKNRLKELIKYVYDWAEQNEIYTLYSVRTLREVKLNARLNIWESFPDDRYCGFTEEYIPTNTLSKNEVFRNLMGNRTFPEPYVIRCQKLKNEYRFPNEQNRVVNPRDA